MIETTERHGRLSLVSVADERSKDGHRVGLWRCECGVERGIIISRVRNGYTKSCGCLVEETAKTINLTHGGRHSGAYSSWSSLRQRCLNPASKDYHRYGGAGITVDPSFDDFAVFLGEVGDRPEGMTIERIDNRRGYEPGNVRWATLPEQAVNRRDSWAVSIDGRDYPSVESAAIAHGVSATTICRWCDGFFDSRRAHQSNKGFTPARQGCWRWRKYAD